MSVNKYCLSTLQVFVCAYIEHLGFAVYQIIYLALAVNIS